jgi:hypothetical protein
LTPHAWLAVAAERAKVGHDAAAPAERAEVEVGVGGLADHVAAVADGKGVAEVAAGERPQVDDAVPHRPRLCGGTNHQ